MNVDAQKPSECHWAAIKMYLSESLMAMVKQLYKPSTLRPMCPVHGTLMVEVYPTPVDSNEPTRDADPAFRCQSEHCELFWAREHEHFELLQGRPVYTNSDPARRMRCLVRSHGCLYLAAIHPTNLWTWKCSVCDYAYTDAPGGWVNPPTWR
jgi:hypothetical protein